MLNKPLKSVRLWPLAFFLLIGGLLFGATPSNVFGQGQATLSQAAEIQQLIAQLGHNEYVKRQQAETQLLERGSEAYSALQMALQHADLEVATRAKYILNQVRIEWVRPTDSEEIRKIMSRYGELSLQQQLKKIAELSLLGDQRGFGALCRIARFDSSFRNKQFAVMAIVEQGLLPKGQVDAVVAMLERESGGVDHDMMAWVRVFIDQLQSPKAVDPRWVPMIAEELAALDTKRIDDEHRLLIALIRAQLKMCDQAADVQQAFLCWQMCVEQKLGLYAVRPNDSLVLSLRLMESVTQETLQLGYALLWLLDHERWQLLPLLEENYSEAIENQRLYRYLVAVVKGRQGLAEESEVLATEALQVVLVEEIYDQEQQQELLEQEATERNVLADMLGELGRHDWAEREWRYVIDTLPATDGASLRARLSYGTFCLHDRLESRAAAELLAESIEAIDSDLEARERYQSEANSRARLKSIRSNQAYFLACHYEGEQEYEKQQQYLERAYKLGPDNADILIAMYRLPGASDTYKKATRSKIAAAKKRLESNFRRNPRDAIGLNHWAWLVSNTEGDFAQAIEYSERSLELDPESASFLDTLGRCYYAAGELEKAVEVQRRAVAKHPHLMVMRRQLELFENELEQRAGAAQ